MRQRQAITEDRYYDAISMIYNFQNQETQVFPRMVIAGISFSCNARCIHCIYSKFREIRESTARGNIFMKEDIFKKVADECSRYKWSLLRLVGFGEPMLHPRFIEMVGYAKKVGCNVGIITNGSLFTKKIAIALLESGIDAIDVSVDAFSKETYEKIRRGLSFEKLIKNVKMLVELRNKYKKDTFIFCSIVEQKEVMHELNQALEFWGMIADKAVSRKFLTFGLLEDNKDRIPYYKERVPCFLLYDRLNIDVNGHIRLCGYDSFARTNFGDILTTTIKDAWHSREMDRIRECHLTGRFEDAGICKDCQDWPFHSWQKNYMADAYRGWGASKK